MSLRPDVETQRIYYDQSWTQERYANLLQLDRAVAILGGLRKLDLAAPRILDFGCGTGWLTAILGRFGPTIGVELSPLAVRKAQALYPDVRFVATNVFDLQEAPESFDVVVSQEVIEHVEDQVGYVNLAARFLRPGGYLILTTPNAWNFAHWTKDAIAAWTNQPIEKWLTMKQLRSLLRPQFKVIHGRTIIFGGFGTRGIFRVINSTKVAAIVKSLGLFKFYQFALERAGFGLHLIVIAERR